MLRVLVGYLLVVNLFAYAVMWVDKRRAARGARRVRERELLLWALAGGTPGVVAAMRIHRHKTRKTSFLWGLLGVVALQMAIAVWALVG